MIRGSVLQAWRSSLELQLILVTVALRSDSSNKVQSLFTKTAP